MRDRMQEIKSKGFNIISGSRLEEQSKNTGYTPINAPIDYSKIKVGAKTLEDATLDIGSLRKINNNLADKYTVLRAIDNYDLKAMRLISEFFYKTSGIYNRMLRYMAFMYRYDWFITPYINDKGIKEDRYLKNFYKALTALDNFNVKKTLGEIALKVLKYGCYYCYKIFNGDEISLQELDSNYCRSRYFIKNKPVVEFNMRYFDDQFRDTTQKMKMLKLFPAEFSKGYSLYKQGKLVPDFPGDDNGWYALDPMMTEKFTANGEDYPAFISVIPLILDLDEAQDLDRKKTMQRLLKIIIQKMPLDKNGELIFDVDEAQQLHNNAVQMLGKAINVDILTTFADVEVASLSDTSAATAQTDDLERVERQVFNEWGGSQMLFNTDGNIALERSILNDAATMYNLLLQFEAFLNSIVSRYNISNKVVFKAQILQTTIYNYQEMAKLYKEQMQLGYSKILAQVALGQSQSSVLANAYFENDVLDLINLFIPPLMSSTLNENILNRVSDKKKALSGENGGEQGRPEKADNEKSEKTIQNKEAMS